MRRLLVLVLLLLASDAAFAWDSDMQSAGFRLFTGNLRSGSAISTAKKYEDYKAYVYVTITSSDIRGDTTLKISAYGVIKGGVVKGQGPDGEHGDDDQLAARGADALQHRRELDANRH